MTVKSYFNLEGETTVEHNSKNNATEDVKLLAKAMILCSDATSANGESTGDPPEIASVSYTHLTLPTSDLVKISVVAGSLKKTKQ